MTSEKNKTIKFISGESYFVTNYNGNRIIFRIVRRTPKFMVIRDTGFGKKTRVGIYANEQGVEYCYPVGKYASKPVLLASNKLNETF